MQIPVTEAFHATDQFESLLVELTPEQIEWLEETAAARGLSTSHMIRTIITARIRGANDISQAPGESVSGESGPRKSGDGTVRPPSVNVSKTDAPPTAHVEDTGTAGSGTEDEADRTDPPSVLESLRSASNSLQNLTDGEEPKKEKTCKAEDANESSLRDTLARLQVHMRGSSRQSASEKNASEEHTSEGTSAADPGPDASEANATKTPSRTMLQNKSMFDMMDEE